MKGSEVKRRWGREVNDIIIPPVLSKERGEIAWPDRLRFVYKESQSIHKLIICSVPLQMPRCMKTRSSAPVTR